MLPINSISVSFNGSGVQENTADTVTCNFERHSDVSFFSPGSTPGVSNDQVFYTVFISISNSGDSMIKSVATFCCVKDTTGVTLEVLVGSVN